MKVLFISLSVQPKPNRPENPCLPSPCGPNAQCQVRGESPACTCLPNYIGAPPNCRPECTINPECQSHLACVNQKCTDPCSGSCGSNARCSVINHTPVCSCYEGYTGDPFTSCIPTPGRNIYIFSFLLVACCSIFTRELGERKT